MFGRKRSAGILPAHRSSEAMSDNRCGIFSIQENATHVDRRLSPAAQTAAGRMPALRLLFDIPAFFLLNMFFLNKIQTCKFFGR